MLFAAALYLTVGDTECPLIRKLFTGYADSYRVSFDECGLSREEETASMAQEIVLGLAQAAPNAAELARYYKRAQAIGEKRINHIVEHKHRNAYGRAALVLAALAEARCAQGDKSEAQSLLLNYYQARYSRFAAFRKEVKEIVGQSPLLRGMKL